jgi:hypothetical protein
LYAHMTNKTIIIKKTPCFELDAQWLMHVILAT